MARRRTDAVLRQRLRRTQGGACAACGGEIEGTGRVHHRQALWLGGAQGEGNCVLLCVMCHVFAPETAAEFASYAEDGGFWGVFGQTCRNIASAYAKHGEEAARRLTELYVTRVSAHRNPITGDLTHAS